MRSPQMATTLFDQLVSMSPQAHVRLAERQCVQLELQEEQTLSFLLRLDESVSGQICRKQMQRNAILMLPL